MAKQRRVAKPTAKPDHLWRRFDPGSIAAGLLAGIIVYLTYYPSDAVAVEDGDALGLTLLSLLLCLSTVLGVRNKTEIANSVAAQQEFNDRLPDPGSSASATKSDRSPFPLSNLSRALDALVWSLAAWMMLAAFATSEFGNLRSATNEAWLWIAAAALFTSVRRIAVNDDVRRATAMLMLVCASGLAVHALHQEFVTLPLNRLEFEKDPERVLQAAGYEAPPGSSERAIFAGRLYDGGPTGTFALANSMAAVLIGGVLFAIGVVRFSWRQIPTIQLATWCTIALICAAGLGFSRSRSAAACMVCGAALLYLIGVDRNHLRMLRSRIIGAIAITVVGLISVLLWFGDREFLASAPASLAFRFQYWRSTLRMVFDHPLFAAGPGHFQAVYERYREASTAEQIADPHNLFFETLGSGGLIGFGLLISSLIVGAMYYSGSKTFRASVSKAAAYDHQRWVWIGAVVALGLIWLFGWASRQLPDVDASLFVLPMVVVIGMVLAPSIKFISSQDLDRVVGVVLLMVLLHLTVSGGWTVPGVAVVVWIAAGILTRVQANRVSMIKFKSHESTISWLAGGLCIGLIALLFFTSLRPVQTAGHQMAIGSLAIESGQYLKAERLLQAAASSDRWSPLPMIGLADLYRWRLINQDLPVTRERWRSAIAEALRRGGDDPALHRVIGSQQLHLFQRYGNPEDLSAASDSFTTAVKLAPMNQWMIAQAASIAAARGDDPMERQLTARARRLSNLGVNVERMFDFQLIYPAEYFGTDVSKGPIRLPAEQVLPEPN